MNHWGYSTLLATIEKPSEVYERIKAVERELQSLTPAAKGDEKARKQSIAVSR